MSVTTCRCIRWYTLLKLSSVSQIVSKGMCLGTRKSVNQHAWNHVVVSSLVFRFKMHAVTTAHRKSYGAMPQSIFPTFFLVVQKMLPSSSVVWGFCEGGYKINFKSYTRLTKLKFDFNSTRLFCFSWELTWERLVNNLSFLQDPCPDMSLNYFPQSWVKWNITK